MDEEDRWVNWDKDLAIFMYTGAKWREDVSFP